jgi:hypothetical protein
MGYRDDFIQRMKDMGLWNDCTDEQRRMYEELSDEQAGRTMAELDALEMGDVDTTRLFGELVLRDALRGFLGVFGGRLLERHGDHAGGLSRAGQLLAEFVDELEIQGIDWGTIASEFPKLNNTSLVFALRQMHREPVRISVSALSSGLC